jgi:hypothetical protein
MTNQEYTDTSDMARISIIINILHEIHPGVSRVIKEKEYNTVCHIVNDWEQNLLDLRKIDK